MDEKKKDGIREEAKALLDSFAKELGKVKISGKKGKNKGNGMREDGEGLKCDEEFRKAMFKNAPDKDNDCIVAEKKSW